MERYSERFGQLVDINYRNFLDAVEAADQGKYSTDSKNQPAMQRFIEEADVDMSVLLMENQRRPGSALTIILKGLMRGLYLSWPDKRRACLYVNAPRDFRPLQPYSDEMAWDVALSYTFPRGESADPPAVNIEAVVSALRDGGLRVFLIQAEDDPADPLWRIRYREALFHSYFMVPVINEEYLAGPGSNEEMFELAGIARRHRSTEFFYPLIPLAESPEALVPRALTARDEALASVYDPNSFDWVRTHLFPVPCSWGTEKIASFFDVLAKGAKGQFDFKLLEFLRDSLVYLELIQVEPRRAVLWLENPTLTYYQFSVSSQVCRWMGVFEPSPTARRAAEFADPIATISDFLGGAAESRIQNEAAPLSAMNAPGQQGGTLILPDLSGVGAVKNMSVSPCGSMLGLQTSQDFRLYSLKTGTLAFPRPHASQLLAWRQDKDLMLLQSDSSITWVGSDGEEKTTAPRPDPAFFAACARDGDICVISTLDDIRILDKETLQERSVTPHAVRYFLLPSVARDGSLFIGPHMGGVSIFSSQLERLAVVTDEGADVALLDAEGGCAYLGLRNGKLCCYAMETARTETLLQLPGKVFDLQWLSDGRLAIVIMDDRDTLSFGTIQPETFPSSSLAMSDVKIQQTKIWELDREHAGVIVWEAGKLSYMQIG